MSGPLEEVVARAKASTDADVGVHASITLAKALLAAGLVDELCLAVGRVLDPVGPRLFDELPALVEMELLEAAPTPTGSLWLRYRLSGQAAWESRPRVPSWPSTVPSAPSLRSGTPSTVTRPASSIARS